MVVAFAIETGCGSDPGPPRHLVLVSIDTLRADFLPVYGHPWVEAPTFTALAAEGAVFERHIAAAPTTLASHVSLMTGTWPHTHRIPRNGFIVPGGNRMLAEILSEAGFEAAAFIGGYPLAQRFGFGQGFEHFEATFDSETPGLARGGAQRAAERLTDDVLAWLSARPDPAKRLFLFVHYFDVHGPYVNPAPFDRMYRRDGLPIRGTFPEVRQLRTAIGRDPARAGASSQALAAQYAAGITYTDHHLGRLVGALRAGGLLEETLFVVTSDHGETMAEHPEVERWDHGASVFETATLVPLVIRLPAGAKGASPGARIPTLTSNVDVLPTVLELLGLPVPDGVEGRSFAALLRGGAFAPHEVVFSEATKPAHPAEEDGSWPNAQMERAARTQRHKLVVRPRSGERLLFDLDVDPGEGSDLLVGGGADARILADRLGERLAAWDAAADATAANPETSPESRDLLEALGYLEDGR